MFEALKLLTTGGEDARLSGVAILQASYDSDKLDPADVALVATQLALFSQVAEPMDFPTDGADTGHPTDPPEEPA